eukprot:CAMPEP_0197023062 /NCGR_PEP_ID=MMETSP1384-20130603/3854_1 /TAXON_ID=29189 /ORGANISM="Ammonia sp." /LENGTH=343 /DNA_ID=CAMNT_0042451221 /DNA_START=145 /DNA_END=1176 /DNA_ORIENTATION=+
MDQNLAKKSEDSEMPAGVVLLLLCIFISLGLVCIRHIKREYDQRRAYMLAKQTGQILSDSVPARKTYGSTHSPTLNSQNIDDYLNDSLRSYHSMLDRLDRYRQAFVDYMERTPEPVLFEVSNDKSVGAFCSNPEFPRRDDDEKEREVVRNHPSDNYRPTPSPALQQLFMMNYEKNQKIRQQQQQPQEQEKQNEKARESEEEELQYDELKEVEVVTKGGDDEHGKEEAEERVESKRARKGQRSKFKTRKTRKTSTSKISLQHRVEAMDFDDVDDATYRQQISGTYSRGDYDSITDGTNHAESDSDRDLSDEDGGYQNIDKQTKRKQKGSGSPLLTTKVVVLDLD